jgi:hypothetical protein
MALLIMYLLWRFGAFTAMNFRCWASSFIRRVILEVLTDVSEDPAASIPLLFLHLQEDGSSRFLRNFG